MSLVLRDLTVRLEGARLFRPLDLTVGAGEVVALMGASGAGKSSLLSGICGALRWPLALEGTVGIDDRDVAGVPLERRGLGVVFQDPMLFPHLSVGENLAFAIPRRYGRAERARRVERALQRAELAGFRDRRPSTLSGGQAARVALMRALLAEPRALLLDEPFAKLDVPLRTRVRAFLKGLVVEGGPPTLLVTHDVADAHDLCARIVALEPPSVEG